MAARVLFSRDCHVQGPLASEASVLPTGHLLHKLLASCDTRISPAAWQKLSESRLPMTSLIQRTKITAGRTTRRIELIEWMNANKLLAITICQLQVCIERSEKCCVVRIKCADSELNRPMYTNNMPCEYWRHKSHSLVTIWPKWWDFLKINSYFNGYGNKRWFQRYRVSNIWIWQITNFVKRLVFCVDTH